MRRGGGGGGRDTKACYIEYPPFVIPLFVIQFITTQAKVWCTLNHLPVTQMKIVQFHSVLYCMTYNYLIILMQVCYDLVFHNYMYIPKCFKSYQLNTLIIIGEQYFTIRILSKHLYLKDRCDFSSLE